MRPSSISFSVYPRYSAGSPGQVDERTALSVAQYELDAHHHIIEGLYGEEKKKEAQEKGLSHIVEEHYTYAHYIRFVDLLTGECGEIRNGKRTVLSITAARVVYHGPK